VLSPFDDYPSHQIPEPIRVVGTTDRNFYDRYYFNIHHCSDELMVTAGMGHYPNRGVVDAFVSVCRGDTQRVVRASRELGVDRMDTTCGPFSIDVIEGLQSLRLQCSPGDWDLDVDMDLTWQAFVPAIAEPRHVYHQAGRVTTDTCRFCQLGFWSGTLRAGDETFEVTPDSWWGGRDRSWGVRPIGEPEHPGIRAKEEAAGFFWIYCTIQFPQYAVVVMMQEDRHRNRFIEEAIRVWPAETGRPPEKLGIPDHEVEFVEGTRTPTRARITCWRPRQAETVIEAEPLHPNYLAIGTGYGMEADWRHGMYQGELVVQNHVYDLTDAGMEKRKRGLVDNLARFTLDGDVGYGLFEFAILGPYDHYGFGRR
jgi:hypothetical protein